MTLVETAKSIVCNIIAVALAMTVSAVEALLPSRPDWLERVSELAIQLKTIEEKGGKAAVLELTDADIDEPVQNPEAPPVDDRERLLQAYDQLWEFVHGVRSDGLLLDDKFCERVEREWTVTTLLSYIRNADRSLQEKAGVTLDKASHYLAAATPDSKSAG